MPAVIGLFNALKETKLGKYCEDYPFPEKFDRNSQAACLSRYKLWKATKKMIPNLDIPVGDITLGQVNPATNLFKSIASISSMNGNNECLAIDLTADEAFTGCFVLPLIVSVDSALQIATDEVIQ